MGSTRIRACAAALLVLAAGGVTAQAAGAASKIWLNRGGIAHGIPGETVHVLGGVEECSFEQQGSLLTNGKAIDRIAGGTTVGQSCPPGVKLAGTVTKVAAGPPFSPPAFAMTFRDTLRVQVEPWCTYRFPPQVAAPPLPLSLAQGTVQAALVKAASFGSCPATREVSYSLDVLSGGFTFYEAEFVG